MRSFLAQLLPNEAQQPGDLFLSDRTLVVVILHVIPHAVWDSDRVRTVHIEAKPDHLLRLARQKDPVSAVAEMIWNALDAEATHVSVDLEVNELNGVESVRVTDDGHGMPNASCAGYFGGLGESWKTTAKLSPELKRGLHGRSGQGRLRAFALDVRAVSGGEL
ncbi:ATP-binding protein [Nonomuraea sp. NPDC005983]|uniref:ATP-binding protein n=1 Tax=Nonomuraea sp. NPDC005983 TaxID=3155595 RepID=UPI0033B6107D